MRLDKFLFENGICESRNKASLLIARGDVKVNGKTAVKNSLDVNDNDKIEICEKLRFVSEGGYKLFKAISDFKFDVSGLICADIGASTGGFTDVLLKNGAKKVYAVDLNDTQLHKSLKDDERVFPLIKNAKDLKKTDFDDKLDLVTADLSFISEKTVLPVLKNIVKDNGHLIVLIKPQFETGEKRRYKNGIIRDGKIIKTAVKGVIDTANEIGLNLIDFTSAPENEEKNREYLALFLNGKGFSFDIDGYYF